MDKKIKEWKKNNTKYFDKEAVKQFKSDFIAHKDVKIETTINAYIELLQNQTDDTKKREKTINEMDGGDQKKHKNVLYQ